MEDGEGAMSGLKETTRGRNKWSEGNDMSGARLMLRGRNERTKGDNEREI